MKPSLESLGPELLRTSRARLAIALASPFVMVALFWIFAAAGFWPGAVAAIMGLSFFSYGSTSHDLVHRNLGLPARVNDALLSLIEALTLRSGHAYRITHLRHHARFPDAEDQEGSPAHRSLVAALLEGPIYIPRLTIWAWKRAETGERRWILAETAWSLAVVVAAVALLRDARPALGIYCALVIAGSWVFPLALVYIQHDPRGANELFQTRAFRGRIIPALLLHHLYHLEHHLYPKVPAHHWRELSQRLDPYFREAGVKIIRIP